MKKFFKALALVLALALVIGVVPAQATSAKIKAKKTLYVDGAKGTSTDGTKTSSYKERVAIYKLAGAKKADKEDHKFTAKIKSGDSVTVSKNYVYAAGLGKSVVEIFKDGESLGTTVVTVKKNATDDTLTITEFEDGKEVVCGVEYTVTLPRKGVDSDERRLFVDGEAVADKEDAPRAYAVKFTKAGDHKVKFEAFQSAELDKATASKEITVKAVMPQPVSAKQVSATAVDVTFSGSMKDLIDPATITASNIYYLIADQHVVTGVVKDVKVSEDDPSVVRITRYTNFIEGETYYFEYGDSKPVSFKIASNKLAEVDSIKVVPADVYYVDKTTPITVKYFNKDGVELDVAAQASPTFEINSEVAYPDGNGIWFTAAGKATIKATVVVDYDESTYAPIEKTDSIEVTGVVASAEVTTIDYSFVGAASKNVHYIRMAGGNYELKAEFKDKNGTVVRSYPSAETTAAGWYLKSTSEDIAQVSGATTVTAVNQGSAVILMCYLDEKNVEQVIKAFPIEVKEANKGTSNVTATLSKQTLNKFAALNDQIDLEIYAMDLDNNKRDTSKLTLTIAQVDNNTTTSGVTLGNIACGTDGEKFTYAIKGTDVTINDATKNGRVAFTVTLKEGSTLLATKTLTFAVAEINPDAPGDVTLGWKLNADKTALDISRKDFDNDQTNITQAVLTVQKTATKNGNQFYLGTDTFTVIKSLSDIPTSVNIGATACSVNYVIPTTPYTKDTVDTDILFADASSNIYNFDANTKQSVVDAAKITLKNFQSNAIASGTNGADMAKSGTYSFTAVRVNYTTADTANAGYYKQSGVRTNIGSAGIVVSGTDVQSSYAEKSAIKASSLRALTLPGDVSSLFKVTWGDLDSDTNPTRVLVTLADGDFKVDDTTESIYVYKLTVTLLPYSNAGMTFVQKLTVNKLYKD